MKVKSEQILKPDAKLVVENIDFSHRKVQEYLNDAIKEWRESKRIKTTRFPKF